MHFCKFSNTTCANKLVAFTIYSPFLALALWGCALMIVASKDRFSISAPSFKDCKMWHHIPSSRHLQKRLYTISITPVYSNTFHNLCNIFDIDKLHYNFTSSIAYIFSVRHSLTFYNSPDNYEYQHDL